MSITDNRILQEIEDQSVIVQKVPSDDLNSDLQQCEEFTRLDKKSPLYAVVHDILLKNASLKLELEKLRTSEGKGFGYTAKSLQEQVEKLQQLIDVLEDKNRLLTEESIEKDLHIRVLEDKLRCNPTDVQIYEGKISQL